MATNTVGRLSVLLAANTSRYKRDMKSAESITSKFAGVAKRAGLAVAAAGAEAAAAAAGGLALLVRQQLSATDALAKSADRVGITTEALAGLQHAAGLAGIGSEQLNKSLQMLNRNLGEARTGVGPAADALRDLGLSADDLSEMPVDRAMRVLADSLNNVENVADRSRLAFDLFGRQGVQLFTLLQGGSAALDSAARDADALGLAVSRVDAARIEAANDAMLRARSVFSGIGRQVAVVVAPAIESVTMAFSRWAQESGGVETKVRGAISGIIGAVAALGDAWDELSNGIQAMGLIWADWKATAIEAIRDVAVSLVKILPERLRSAASAAGAVLTATAATARAEDNASRRNFTSSDIGGNIRRFGAGILNAPDIDPNVRAQIEAQEDTTDAINDLRSAIDTQTSVLSEAINRASPGDVNSLVRVLDRIALMTGGPNSRSLAGAP